MTFSIPRFLFSSSTWFHDLNSVGSSAAATAVAVHIRRSSIRSVAALESP